MSKVLWNSMLVIPVFLSAIPTMARTESATEVQIKTEQLQSPLEEGEQGSNGAREQRSKGATEQGSNGESFHPIGTSSLQKLPPITLKPIEEFVREQRGISNSGSVAALGKSEVKTYSSVDIKTAVINSSQSVMSQGSRSIHEAAPQLVADAMGQVTSVTQLSDVQPTDWAYEALRSLVERYGCIAGYPNRTFRGNRAITRYEFAAGLNVCLEQISRLIAASTQNFVTREDLERLQRLQQEFASELTALRGRVDLLDSRVAFLENHQFSTTTKLNAEVVFGLSSILAGDRADGQPAPKNPVFSDRIRLNFDTSFSGKDRLRIRLQALDVVPYNTILQTFEGRLNYDGNSNNNVTASLIQYRFPISPVTTGYIAAFGNGFQDLDFTGQLNPYFEGGVSISNFGLRNPVYTYAGGTGFGIRHQFNKTFELDAGYLVNNGANPTDKNGLFNGKYAGLAQLIISPTNNLKFGFIYENTYSPAINSFGPGSGGLLANSNFGRAVSANAYAFGLNYSVTPKVNLGGWVGYVNQRYIGRGDASVLNWAATLAFPDFGKKGSILGFLVGMEPKVLDISNNVNGGRSDRDTSLQIESFYWYQFTDKISITPGIIWITAPNHDDRNNDVLIGVIRTVFRF